MKKTLLILSLLFLVGCVSEVEDEQKFDRLEQAIEACIYQGGIPIYNSWSATRLSDCKFNNN